jgi:hypothetical protein
LTVDTILPVAAVAMAEREQVTRIWRCQFCVEGHHGSCPGAIRQLKNVGTQKHPRIEQYLWKCLCRDESHPGLHCLECKNQNRDEVDERTWSCIDRHVCAGILAKRRENSRLWQMLQAARSHSANVRRAKRMKAQALATELVHDDARIEQVHKQLDSLASIRSKSRGSSPPRPKQGKCECCGEATRGGRFLPGHDAKLASRLKERVASGDAKAYEEMKGRNWLSKLPAHLREGVS